MKAIRPHGTFIGSTLLGGLVLALAGCALAPSVAPGPPRGDSPNLVALHDAKSPSFNRNCLSCHGKMMDRATLNPKIKEAHAAMIPFAAGYDVKVGVTNETCASCHGKVDLVQHSGEQIRKNADVASCAACHGKSGPASKKFYAN
jgi:nitrate reductase cytochrome c-type subunit